LLPRELLDVTREADLVRPRWLLAGDEAWIAGLCDQLDALGGRTGAEVSERLACFKDQTEPPLSVATVVQELRSSKL